MAAKHRPLPVAAPSARTPADRALLVWAGAPPEDGLATSLADGGHDLFWVPDARGALAAPIGAALVVDTALPDGDGIAVLEELRRRAPDLVCVALAAQPTYAAWRRALHAGARDLLPRPVDADELLVALATRRGEPAHDALFHRERACERDLLPLAAALLADGVDGAARARIVSAVAELLAASGDAATRVVVRRAGARIDVRVHADALGTDAHALVLAASADPTSGHVARAAALAEACDVRRERGALTLALAFDVGARLVTAGDDLSTREWLDAPSAHALLEAIGRGDAPLAPSHAVSVVLGRWLGRRAHAHAERRAQRALWS